MSGSDSDEPEFRIKQPWCDYCNNYRDVVFSFNDEIRCEICLPHPYCTQCDNCITKGCYFINSNFYTRIRVRFYGNVRRYCCNARYKEKCEGCKKPHLLLGVHRFRRKTLLASLPKDVLRYLICNFL